MIRLFSRRKPGLAETPPLERFTSPVPGKYSSLESVEDEVFSSGMVGPGFSVIPIAGTVYAPIDATVAMIFPTMHALGLKTAMGVDLLLHIGIDTVNLEGRGFNKWVEVNQKVSKGDKLMTFDQGLLKELGYNDTVIVVITNPQGFAITNVNQQARVQKDDVILEVSSKSG